VTQVQPASDGHLAAPTGSQPPGLLARWREVLRTTNPPEGRLDPVSKWLVLTRAAVLPMTLTAGIVAGLLAVRAKGFNAGWFVLALAGILLAHASNNLMNDLFDLESGLDDSAQYPRALYAPHPILSGMTTRRGLLGAALAVNLLDLAILFVLFMARGWPVVAFALAGFFLSVAYTAPPLRLKKRGLGEPTVLAVWGPLMVGGTYYASVGRIPWQVIAASIPYGLLCTAVLFGKHIDKIAWDAPQGIRTMPVLLGERRARLVSRALMVSFYVTTAILIGVGALPWPTAVVAAAIPTLVKVWKPFSHPRPEQPPARFPVWPLWFAAIAFLHTRRAGALLVLGLLIAAIFNL
jgi:1,4-dihydroxy-2-naphthoate octaprenyltransferase